MEMVREYEKIYRWFPTFAENGAVGPTAGSSVAARERRIAKRTIGKHQLTFDRFTSRRMSVVRQRGTGPEVVIRAIVSRLGSRFRVENGDLPGSPDLANRSRRWVIFVHGCFWHAHSVCKQATVPKRNRGYWVDKLATNKARDVRATRQLRKLGYAVLKVWQCQLARPRRCSLEIRLRKRLVQSGGWQAPPAR